MCMHTGHTQAVPYPDIHSTLYCAYQGTGAFICLTWPGLPAFTPPPRPSDPESWCTRDSGRMLKSTLAAWGMSVLLCFGACDSLDKTGDSRGEEGGEGGVVIA